MKNTITTTHCDRCGKKLLSDGSLNIVSPIHESQRSWGRLHVTIDHRHGYDNNATTDNADLCRDCAIYLLENALARARGGERVSAGVEDPKQLGWN